MAYRDSDDLPPDAGTERCPSPPPSAGPKHAAVRLELIAATKPSVDLVIPSLSVRKRLWSTDSPNLQTCYVKHEGDSIRFSCSEVMTSTTGKVYARGSDIVLGMMVHSSGTTETTRYPLPCGVVARFERVACPSRCHAADETSCDCVERAGPSPKPTR